MELKKTIIKIGKEYSKDFSLDVPSINSNYLKIYNHFAKSFDNEKEKSILLLGGIGTGKTIMMKIFQRLLVETPRQFKWADSNKLRYMVEDLPLSEIMDEYGGNLKMDLYIDDIGLNGSGHIKFGNSINIITEIIIDRYPLFINYGYKTHISSNLPFSNKPEHQGLETVQSIFGNRVHDRLKETSEIFIIEGSSLRK